MNTTGSRSMVARPWVGLGSASNLARECDVPGGIGLTAPGWRTFVPSESMHSRAWSRRAGPLEAVVLGEESRILGQAAPIHGVNGIMPKPQG